MSLILPIILCPPLPLWAAFLLLAVAVAGIVSGLWRRGV